MKTVFPSTKLAWVGEKENLYASVPLRAVRSNKNEVKFANPSFISLLIFPAFKILLLLIANTTTSCLHNV